VEEAVTELLCKDDEVLITYGDLIIRGRIDMISKNQVSALITFDAVIGRHFGSMPVMLHDVARGAYRSIVDDTEITVRRKPVP
jgi:hypothetical protein